MEDDLDYNEDIESFDLKKIGKIFGAFFLGALVLVVGLYLFNGRDNIQPYDGDFSLTSADKTSLNAMAENFVTTAGTYGVNVGDGQKYSAIDKDNYFDLLNAVSNKYSLETTDPDIITRKAVYEQSIGFLNTNASIKTRYDSLNSDDMLTYLPTFRVSDIEVAIPDEGYTDLNASQAVIVTVKFKSTKTLTTPLDADVNWDGIVNVLQKEDDETVQIVFKKDDAGVWGVDRYDGLADPTSLGLSIPPAILAVNNYSEISTFDTGEKIKGDDHTEENTSPDTDANETTNDDETGTSFDNYPEKDGVVILPDTPAQD